MDRLTTEHLRDRVDMERADPEFDPPPVAERRRYRPTVEVWAGEYADLLRDVEALRAFVEELARIGRGHYPECVRGQRGYPVGDGCSRTCDQMRAALARPPAPAAPAESDLDQRRRQGERPAYSLDGSKP